MFRKKKQFYDIYRPKKEFKIPKVISKNKIKKILLACKNIKHKAILSLIYSAGLRRSELINLEVTDIHSDRMVIVIRNKIYTRITWT